MSYLKHPLQAGGRWLRQAAVLGLGAGLLAGTGLIVTASVASAHSAAPATAASHVPSRACALVIGRPGHLRVRPEHCRPPMVVALASPVCQGRLLPAPGRVVIGRPLRLPRAVHVAVHGRLRLPVLRVRACAVRVLRIKPAQLRIKPAQLRLCGKVRPAQVKLRVAGPPARIRLVAPGRACSLVPVPARR
jgi:hypothetical protein